MIIHSHKKHISLQILHWTRNDVVVQCSVTRVCQGVPNKMLGASYTNRDVSSFQTRDLYCNGRTCMYNCPTFFLFWKCLDDMSYWTNLYRTVADNELHFLTISNLNYTVFVSLAHKRTLAICQTVFTASYVRKHIIDSHTLTPTYNTSHNNCKHPPTCAMISSTPGFETLLAPNICTLNAPRRRGGPRSPTVGTTAPIKASRVAASNNADRPRIAITLSAQTCMNSRSAE